MADFPFIGTLLPFYQENKTLNSILAVEKQVKPGFTNYQPRGLADQIKFEV